VRTPAQLLATLAGSGAAIRGAMLFAPFAAARTPAGTASCAAMKTAASLTLGRARRTVVRQLCRFDDLELWRRQHRNAPPQHAFDVAQEAAFVR
jgi:hypothetical protein